MKNLIFVFALLLPLATIGQSEITLNKKKNTITASAYLSGHSGLAIDYRRTLIGNQQLVIGVQKDRFSPRQFVFGYRYNIKPENKLSYAVGLDVLTRKRNVIGDNFVSRTIELVPRPEYKTLRFVGGFYYELTERVDLMTEIHMKTMLSALFSNRASNSLHFGLKYDF